jgi:hypothetical protein
MAYAVAASSYGMFASRRQGGIYWVSARGDPDSACVGLRGQEEGIGDAMAAKVRNALAHYRPLTKSENVEIRLHRAVLYNSIYAVLYNSIYRADGRVFVNQHTYGIPAARSPVFCYRESECGGIANAYLDSFEKVWMSAKST